jgi:hypothetical protein
VHAPRLQAYSKPPALVELTLSAVMTVLRRPATWDEAKKQMGDAGFMGKLLTFDKVRAQGLGRWANPCQPLASFDLF